MRDGGAAADRFGRGRRGQRAVASRPSCQMQQIIRIGDSIAGMRDKVRAQGAGIGKPHADMKPAAQRQTADRFHQFSPPARPSASAPVSTIIMRGCQDQRHAIRHRAAAALPLGRQMRKPDMDDESRHAVP